MCATMKTSKTVLRWRCLIVKKKALSRNDRKRQIMLAFAVNLQSGKDGRMTIADIARSIQLSASTKLRNMVTELVIEGLLVDEKEDIPGVAKFRRIYTPSALFDISRGKRKQETRTIQIKAKRNGQQVMWDEVLS